MFSNHYRSNKRILITKQTHLSRDGHIHQKTYRVYQIDLRSGKKRPPSTYIVRFTKKLYHAVCRFCFCYIRLCDSVGLWRRQTHPGFQYHKQLMVGHIDGAKKLKALRSMKVQDHDLSVYSIQVDSTDSLTIINLGCMMYSNRWFFESCQGLAICFKFYDFRRALDIVRS